MTKRVTARAPSHCEQCDGRLIVGSESVRVPASEYCHCPAADDDDEEAGEDE
jgi:hypothetical protein